MKNIRAHCVACPFLHGSMNQLRKDFPCLVPDLFLLVSRDLTAYFLVDCLMTL